METNDKKKRLSKAERDALFRSIPLPLSKEDWEKLVMMCFSHQIKREDMPPKLLEEFLRVGADWVERTLY